MLFGVQILFAAVISAAGFFRPAYNWDLFAYMGLAAERSNSTDLAIHRAVYDEARDRMPPEKFSEAIQAGTVRGLVYDHPEWFRQQFGWYRQRFLYVSFARAFRAIGLSPMSSVQLVSVLSFFGLNVFFGFWVMKYAPARVATLIGSAACLNFADLSRLATPDTLYALAVLLALYLLIERKQPHYCCLLLLVSLLIRNDGVLLAVAILFYATCLAPKHSRLPAIPAAVMAIGFAIASVFLSRIGGHYGWAALMYNSFFGGVADPAHFTGTISPGMYARLLIMGLASIPSSGIFVFVIMAAVAYYATRRTEKLSPPLYVALPACLTAAMTAHYLLYPVVLQRHMLPVYYILIFLTVHMLWSPHNIETREAHGACT